MYLDAATFLVSTILAFALPSVNQRDSGKPDPTLIRLENAYSFSFGGVGMMLATSESEVDYRTIISRTSASEDLEELFRRGNAPAKCYALTGLRKANPARFEALAAGFHTTKTCIPITRGCLTFAYSAAEVVRRIRAGMYSGPLTHGLIPAPTPERPPAADQQLSTWGRFLGLFNDEPPGLVGLAPPPNPPSPPPANHRAACIVGNDP